MTRLWMQCTTHRGLTITLMDSLSIKTWMQLYWHIKAIDTTVLRTTYTEESKWFCFYHLRKCDDNLWCVPFNVAGKYINLSDSHQSIRGLVCSPPRLGTWFAGRLVAISLGFSPDTDGCHLIISPTCPTTTGGPCPRHSGLWSLLLLESWKLIKLEVWQRQKWGGGRGKSSSLFQL